MGRRYGDVVHVRQESGQHAPREFVWRERLYVVEEVLGHWHERTSWWEAPGARAVHGEEPSSGVGAPRPGGDEEVWRVAASAGRQADVGTYDLGRPGGDTAWRLLRVVD